MNKLIVSVAILFPFLLCACASVPSKEAERHALVTESDVALESMLLRDPSLQERVAHAYAYAIFPGITKGGAIVGGAFGRGVVIEHGKLAGYASITQGSLGGQIGGRSYSQLVVFQNGGALKDFQNGKLKFGAEATAVALDEGVCANTRYLDGIAVFALPRAGLMADASLSGQSFTFQPAAATPTKALDDRYTAIQLND